MTTTAKAVLFGTAEPGAVVAESPGWRGAIQRLGGALTKVSAAGKAAVERELSAALGHLLEQDLGRIIVAGLRRHPALIAAAEATAANPSASEVVQLASNRITNTHQPYVDIVINGVKAATVQFQLDLTFDIDVLVGTVRAARLISLQSGHCTATVALLWEQQELAKRDVQLDLSVTVPLGDGVPLLEEEPRPAVHSG
jgi:hypothetical protein